MPDTLSLNWIDGAGWLVLSGTPDSLGDIRAMALTRTIVNSGVAYIGLSNDENDDLIDDFGELGAPTGYWVNIMLEDDVSIRKQLSEAAVIVIPGNLDLSNLRGGLLGAAVEGMKEAYQNGAVVLAEGSAASLFGKLAITDSGAELGGLEWVMNSFIVPNITTIGDSAQARQVLLSGTAEIAIGISEGSALALGPDWRIETWARSQVTIALGVNSISDQA